MKMIYPRIRGTHLHKNTNMRYCNTCRALRDPPHRSENRLFEKVIGKMNRMNPVAFRLPKHIRAYFDGVATGDDGEYQETHDVKPIKANSRGLIEEPDPFRLRDKLGRVIICYRCGETASVAKRMLSCDHCTQHWHMDCLDPPLTALPPLTKKWMCPLHASHAYRRMRRPKHNMRVVDVSLPRGFKNWGDIEVDNEENEREVGEGHRILKSGFEPDFQIDGVTYRLPEKGIKLDFLDKIHMYCLLGRELTTGRDIYRRRWMPWSTMREWYCRSRCLLI
jgi:PHD-finger